MRGLVVVDADAADARVGLAAGHGDGRRAGRGNQLDQVMHVAQRRRQDDAVDAVRYQAARLFDAVFIGLAFFHHQLHVVRAGLVQQADQELAH
ncbi:conserved hypothetical protein, partial [Ricinus communis]